MYQWNEIVKPARYAFGNMFIYDPTFFSLMAILRDHSNIAQGL
jgi:hypothetical protein